APFLKAARYRACAPRPSARAKVASQLFLCRAATPPRLRRGVLRFYCLLLLRCFIRLATARAAQNIFQRVIAFVARVFVDVGVSRGPGVFARPRPVPGIGILDGEAIQ